MKYVANFTSKPSGFVYGETFITGHRDTLYKFLRENAEIYDLSGKKSVYRSSFDLLGVGFEPGNSSRHIAVPMTQKEALLHKYVEVNGRREEVLDSDFANFATDRGLNHFEGTTALEIALLYERLSIFGTKGSIVMWRGKGTSGSTVIISLYDFLCYMSQMLKINIFAYECIQFCSEIHQSYWSIRLDQSVEAKRYFTKMWLDACVGGVSNALSC